MGVKVDEKNSGSAKKPGAGAQSGGQSKSEPVVVKSEASDLDFAETEVDVEAGKSALEEARDENEKILSAEREKAEPDQNLIDIILMQNRNIENMMSAITGLLQKQGQSLVPVADQPRQFGIPKPGYMSQDDILKVPIAYFSPVAKFALFSERRNGNIEIPPSGSELTFEPLVRYQDRSTKRVVSMSGYICRSKMMQEFIEGSDSFMVKIFRDNKAIKSNDMDFFDILSQTQREVRGWKRNQLLTAAVEMGVETGSDMDVMRKEIARKLARQQYDSYSESQKAKVAENYSHLFKEPNEK